MFRRAAHKVKKVLARLSPPPERFIEDAYRSVIGQADPASTSGAVVIFSMDRAMQLQALLTSYFAHVANPVPVTVLYRTTSDGHARAYEQVFAEFGDRELTPVRQLSGPTFRPQVLEIVDRLACSKIIFLVDDILFIHPVDFQEILAPDTRDCVTSLRLGQHLKRSYTVNQEQPLPRFEPRGPFLTWRWQHGSLDWGYPLSVDGHVFGLRELRAFIAATEFDSPNTFEGNLQRHVGYFKTRFGLCYPVSRIVNAPWNKVQKDNENLHGAVHQDEFLQKWHDGFRIHVESYYGMLSESCHQELVVRFVRRGLS